MLGNSTKSYTLFLNSGLLVVALCLMTLGIDPSPREKSRWLLTADRPTLNVFTFGDDESRRILIVFYLTGFSFVREAIM